MKKQKLYAFVMIGGFALGIAACMLIALLVKNELSYDRYYKNENQIFRLVGVFEYDGKLNKSVAFAAPMAKALVNDFPEVVKAARLMPNNLFGGAGNNQIRPADKMENTYEEGFTFADQDLLDILEVKMVYGNREKALVEPFSMVISKRKADKLFPGENPVGKIVYLNNNTKMPVKIGGVMENFPPNSHMQYDFLISLAGVSFWDGEQDSWEASNYVIYFTLKPGTNIATTEKKFTKTVLEKYVLPTLKKTDAEQVMKSSKLTIQPVNRIHLYSDGIGDYVQRGDIRFVVLFAAIAIFILLIACINFLNLSTARSANRAKEVGLRKVVGSTRKSLITQFLSESVLYSLIAFILAILISYLLLPVLNQVAQKNLTFPFTKWWFIPIILISVTVVGILAGIYPSFYLSSFNPIQVLKGKLKMGSKNGGLRSVLVIFQFTTSVILLIGTMVIYRQMQYILNKKVGFDKDQVVMVQGTSVMREKTATFRDELMKIPGVSHVSLSDFLPIAGTKRNGNTFYKEGKTQEEAGIYGQNWTVDAEYIPTMGMKLVAGRNFSKEMATDEKAAIINQAMAAKIGYPDPIGKIITNGWASYNIIGVVEDFNFETFKEKVQPLLMAYGNSNDIISIKFNSKNSRQILGAIEKSWKQFNPNINLRYRFMDESFAAMYDDITRTGKIFTGFSILAIIVACLGLFALATFMAEQRSKEISIRKVLGASVSGLFNMLTGNFLKLIAISLLIAIPIGWWMMNAWLQDYNYRTPLSWDLFAIPGLAILAIGMVTICYQAIKAAVASPINSLRSE